MAHLQIKSYGLSDTTLEEIFLKVASNIHDGEIVREIQYEDITDHGRLVGHLFFSFQIPLCSRGANMSKKIARASSVDFHT